MTNLYRPPFDPYSERQEASDPNAALRTPWDGCWAWTLARATNGTTGGKVTCIVPGKTVEKVIRDAAGVPDRPGYADGGTIANQITALDKLAPVGTWYSARPTQAEFRAHLAAGGIAVMAGWEDQAPASDAAYDSRFYYNHGSNGHNNFCQGVGDGVHVIWGNPEKFSGVPEPIVTIDAALKFVWDSQAGGYPRVEALLLRSVEMALPISTPTPTPGGNMDVIAITPVSQVNCAAGGSLRNATTGAVINAKWTAQTGLHTWGQAGADTIIQVQDRVGGPLIPARYPTALCTPVRAVADPAPLAALQAKIDAAKAALG